MKQFHFNLIAGRIDHYILVAERPLPPVVAVAELLRAADNRHINTNPLGIKGPATKNTERFSLLIPGRKYLFDSGIVMRHVAFSADLDTRIIIFQINLRVGCRTVFDHHCIGLAGHCIILAVGLNNSKARQSETHVFRGDDREAIFLGKRRIALGPKPLGYCEKCGGIHFACCAKGGLQLIFGMRNPLFHSLLNIFGLR